MRDLAYYDMRAFLLERQIGDTATFRLNELAEKWECSDKNVKRKLKKYQELQFCHYQPGRGRGNASKITFTQSFQSEIEDFIRNAVAQENLDKLLTLLQLDIPREWFSAVSSEINELFGLHTEKGDQDILRLVIARPFSILDPLHTSINMESSLLLQLGDPLVRFDTTTNTVMPCIAHHWKAENNSTIWTFYIRKGIRFHHGRTLTSTDIRHTLEKAMQKGTVTHWYLTDIIRIELLSETKITIHLHKPNPFFIRYLCLGNLVILPHDIPFDEYKWTSTGAFKLAQRSSQKLVLEAFDSHFLERPFLDRIEFWLVKDQTNPVLTVTNMGNADNLDYTDHATKDYGVNIVTFNFKHCAFAHHPAFREAFYHLLDPQKMIRDLENHEESEASSYFFHKSSAQQRDSSKIKRLLETAHYTGETLRFAILSHAKSIRQGQWIVAQAAKFGISLDLHIIDISSEFYQTSQWENIDISMGADVPSSDIEVAFMDFYGNPNLAPQRFLAKKELQQIEELLHQARQCTRFSDRDHFYDQIESFVRDNHLFLFLEHLTKHQFIHATIQTEDKHLYGHLNLKKLWID
ncbi:SgrR family transcriptional regulator [Listeria sp. FSL L7-1582]|uniref:ABC transporter substrate-binding protein n=1 Tax=Listeria portnoyi TaxID=2713504 RepID=UPI00164E4E9D|nr:ABC transporter substrate-binding protein [Listeria portnoyi]MBC6308422.1 SgrR family transcriptional regulator [Listeria portnoyi]